MNSRLPWMILVTVGLVGLILGSFTPEGWWALSWLGYPIVGGVLVWKQPQNSIGRLLVGIGFGWGLNFILEALIDRSLASPSVVWFELLSEPVGMLPWLFMIDLTLIFPSGRASSRTSQWIRRVLVVVGAVLFVSVVVDPAPLDFSGLTSPLAIEMLRAPTSFINEEQGFLIVPLLLLFGLVSLFVRWRRSQGVERLQLQWFVFALLVTILLLAPEGLFQQLDFAWLAPIVLNLLPLAIGVAVLRYRLFEIDRIMSRTVGFALVAAIVAAIYGFGRSGCQLAWWVSRPRCLSPGRRCWQRRCSIRFGDESCRRWKSASIAVTTTQSRWWIGSHSVCSTRSMSATSSMT